MRPTRRRIATVTIAAELRLARLERLAATLSPNPGPAERRALSFIAIETANLWAQYATCLFISAALGAADSTGARIPSPASTESDALDLGVYAVHPGLRGVKRKWTRQELPDFQSKGHLTACLKYISATVSPVVDAAVSYNSRVLYDLPTVRNFFAHKSRDAARSALKVANSNAVIDPKSPYEMLCMVPVGSRDMLVREWIADLAAILQRMPH